jgi:hypothetical protein
VIARVACTPSMSGIRTSTSTTSGGEFAGEADRFVSVGCFADDVDAVVRVEDHAKPHAQQWLVIGEQYRHGHGIRPNRYWGNGRGLAIRRRWLARPRWFRRRRRRVPACR